MPRSIIGLPLENESENQIVLTDANQANEIITVNVIGNGNGCNNDNSNSLSVFSESQLRDITEVLEIQSRTSGLGESCSNSCYSTSSSSLPSNDNGSDQITETNQVISSSSPSSPTSATVTVSTCPSCGSENVDPCLKSSLSSASSSSTSSPHHRYSNELSSSKKWKSYSRPEMINSKSSYRSSPYKIKSHCTNSSFKQSSRHHGHSHHHHHHGHHHNHGHHRLNTRSSSKKHSLSSELEMIRSKSKSKRDRYSCSKLSSINDSGRCHVCKQVGHDESRLHSFNQRSSSSSTIKGTDCPYSLTKSNYDDDHLMSHLCDIDSWHRRRKRETLKKKERAIIAILSIIAILIFIAMSYFGTILFLRITTMPIS
ncbi:uncharacterized protein LOC128397910 [Panonychus citri]|uniref:uncharacterized protein LOC128397910 n=1 Tax=Panonychus citri TaxID=50023 RepID=UPI002307AC63|nr:uncharacterized protein LOC128397910 [Panonychus citri]